MEAMSEDKGVPKGPAGIYKGYAHEHRPLGAYAFLTSISGSVLLALLAEGRRNGRLPEKIAAADILLMGAATQKLTRVISKDSVTSWLRAPFTEYDEPGAPGEVNEKPRGQGLQLAMGELLGCPFCLAQWIATGFMAGLTFSPRVTRVIASIFTVETISDFMQLAYGALEQRAE
jgi:Protein of unknown function (DUF1360)